MILSLIYRDNTVYELQRKTKTIDGEKYGDEATHKIYLSNAVLREKYNISWTRLARLRNEQNKLIFIYSLNDSMTQKMAA